MFPIASRRLRSSAGVRGLFATIADRYNLIKVVLSLDFDRPSNAVARALYLQYLTLRVAYSVGYCTAIRIRTGTSRPRFAAIPAGAGVARLIEVGFNFMR
jgi:hypothetical protein